MFFFYDVIAWASGRIWLAGICATHTSKIFDTSINGVIDWLLWGVWHLPAFYLAGTVFADWQFCHSLLEISKAVMVTPLFNASKGSLLKPMMFHWQLINPFGQMLSRGIHGC
ncbi:hypothetical protein HND97_11445 [Vibrio cholerae]|nr:hypothetical protein HND97_11445 [Vibrio cholerae]